MGASTQSIDRSSSNTAFIEMPSNARGHLNPQKDQMQQNHCIYLPKSHRIDEEQHPYQWRIDNKGQNNILTVFRVEKELVSGSNGWFGDLLCPVEQKSWKITVSAETVMNETEAYSLKLTAAQQWKIVSDWINGTTVLWRNFGYFSVEPAMVGINTSKVGKVWINKNFAANKPELIRRVSRITLPSLEKEFIDVICCNFKQLLPAPIQYIQSHGVVSFSQLSSNRLNSYTTSKKSLHANNTNNNSPKPSNRLNLVPQCQRVIQPNHQRIPYRNSLDSKNKLLAPVDRSSLQTHGSFSHLTPIQYERHLEAPRLLPLPIQTNFRHEPEYSILSSSINLNDNMKGVNSIFIDSRSGFSTLLSQKIVDSNSTKHSGRTFHVGERSVRLNETDPIKGCVVIHQPHPQVFIKRNDRLPINERLIFSDRPQIPLNIGTGTPFMLKQIEEVRETDGIQSPRVTEQLKKNGDLGSNISMVESIVITGQDNDDHPSKAMMEESMILRGQHEEQLNRIMTGVNYSS